MPTRGIGILVQAGKWTIYCSGDCVPYEGLVERLTRWKIDLALLPINLVIPCHHEMFEFNTVSPEEFVTSAEQINQNYHVLKGGDRLDL